MAAIVLNKGNSVHFLLCRFVTNRWATALFPHAILPAGVAIAVALVSMVAQAAERPNIVIVITDDQGYGDLGCTGNPVVKTPHIDRLAAESSLLTDYHVAPTCSPTRAALLTGRWSNRTGVWHTINGRSLLRENEVTLGEMLKNHGYATGMFGKWHLGDNYPFRPEDRGFTEVYRHGGGGVGHTPDAWDNAYFDGRYFHNDKLEAAKGFCTDVFFEQAQRFIRAQADAKKPFFAYIATNAAHGPLHAPQKYLDLYQHQSTEIAAFFGMISNIDDNVGATRKLLRELGIADNTLFIFTTDNGTATGARVFNAGMRANKGSEYDGGHRVPLIAHWPAGGWKQEHANDTLCHAVDLVPTLLEVAGVPAPMGIKLDGVSIRSLLDPNGKPDLADRMLVTDSQRVRDPIKWQKSAVMSQQWRLVNGKELYEIKKDPGQKRDVAAEHPDQVAKMTAFYDAWWAELQPTFARMAESHLGHPDHPVISLNSHDWIQEAQPPWNQQTIRNGYGLPQPRAAATRESTASDLGEPKPRPKAKHLGHWAVKVVNAGKYEISVRRWPLEADHPITAGLPPGENVPGADRAFRARPGLALPIVSATLRIDGHDLETLPVSSTDRYITFTTELAAGSHQLAPFFTTSAGDELGAYYTIVTTKAAASAARQETPR